MPPKPVELGATGQVVAKNLAYLRKSAGLSLRELAERMPEGRKLNHAQLSAIEHQRRQVNVDDLTALASALGVAPVALLMLPWTQYRAIGEPPPLDRYGYEEYEADPDSAMYAGALTGTAVLTPAEMLDWLTGEYDGRSPLDDEHRREEFRRASLPPWKWKR